MRMCMARMCIVLCVQLDVLVGMGVCVCKPIGDLLYVLHDMKLVHSLNDVFLKILYRLMLTPKHDLIPDHRGLFIQPLRYN